MGYFPELGELRRFYEEDFRFMRFPLPPSLDKCLLRPFGFERFNVPIARFLLPVKFSALGRIVPWCVLQACNFPRQGIVYLPLPPKRRKDAIKIVRNSSFPEC